MNTNKNIKEWIKEHKIEIGLGALAVITTISSIVLFKKLNDPTKIIIDVNPSDIANDLGIRHGVHLGVSDIGIGDVDNSLIRDDGSIELWLDNVTLKQMGKLGENISRYFKEDGISEDSKVWTILEVLPTEVT